MATLLTREGTELEIKKAFLDIHVHLSQALSATSQLGWGQSFIFAVSDQAMADYTPAAATRDLATLLDGTTAGNIEFDVVSKPKHSRCLAHGGASAAAGWLHTYCDQRVDFTPQLRKACQKLVRSAILSTDPSIALLMELQSDTAMTIYYRFSLVIEYVERPRPSRML
jgi:hypothetical protein